MSGIVQLQILVEIQHNENHNLIPQICEHLPELGGANYISYPRSPETL